MADVNSISIDALLEEALDHAELAACLSRALSGKVLSKVLIMEKLVAVLGSRLLIPRACLLVLENCGDTEIAQF